MAEAEWRKRHQEIDRIHRRILARLDESDRRAAEREKQREQQGVAGSTWDFAGSNSAEHEKRREELRAKLAAYGLREVSSDELLESFKRFSASVDRVLRDKEAKGMADVAWEERLKRLEEVTTVNASLIVRIEQNMDRLIQTVDRIAQAQADGFAELRASQVTLMKTFDQFIRGKEGNGRKQ